MSMLRRLGILGVLLFSVSGFVPAALACAAMAAQTDCCPEGTPCDEGTAPAWEPSIVPACCSAAPAPERTVLASVLERQKKDSSLDRSNSDQWMARTDASAWAAFASPRPKSVDSSQSLPTENQQQTYLLTGRLRL